MGSVVLSHPREWMKKIRNVALKIPHAVNFSSTSTENGMNKIFTYSQQTPFQFKVDSIFARHCVSNVLLNFSLRVVQFFILMANSPVGESPCRRNVLSANYPVAELSYRRTVLPANCPIGQLSGRRTVYWRTVCRRTVRRLSVRVPFLTPV